MFPGSPPNRTVSFAPRWLGLAVFGLFALSSGAAAQQTIAPQLRGDIGPGADAPAGAADDGADMNPAPDRPPAKKPLSTVGARPPKTDPTALPPLQPYRGAQRSSQKGGPPDPNGVPAAIGGPQVVPGPTVAAVPSPPPARKFPPPDEHPYDPVGLRLGDFDVKPYVEQDVGANSNPLSSATTPKSSLFETTEVGGSWQSNWSRDDFHGELKGGYTDNVSTTQANNAFGSGTASGRLDVTRELNFDAEGRFNVTNEALSALGFTSATPNANPYVLNSTYGLTLGGVRSFGDLSLGLHGLYDRNAYQNVPILGAVSGNLSRDDYDDWALRGRASYRLSEAVSPFVELGFDTRRYAGQTDALGYARDSNGVTARVGATLAISQMLTGEASLGYGERQYQDSRLPHASAALIDGSLIWSPTALTTVTAKAATQLSDSVLAGASADINRSYSLDIEHALRRSLILGVTGGYATDRFVGTTVADSNTTFGAKAEYHVNRDVVVKASAQRQLFDSNQLNQSYTADVFMLGVRLQR